MGKKKVKYMVKLSRVWDNVPNIWPTEIERETPKSVWVNGDRNLKRSNYWNYYDSFKEAKQTLLEAQRTRIKQLQKTLERAESILDDIKGLSLNAK